jgi:hypothetical protein
MGACLSAPAATHEAPRDAGAAARAAAVSPDEELQPIHSGALLRKPMARRRGGGGGGGGGDSSDSDSGGDAAGGERVCGIGPVGSAARRGTPGALQLQFLTEVCARPAAAWRCWEAGSREPSSPGPRPAVRPPAAPTPPARAHPTRPRLDTPPPPPPRPARSTTCSSSWPWSTRTRCWGCPSAASC